MAKWEEHWPAFEEKLKARLSVGAVEYGDKSFDLPHLQLLYELRQETLDIVGWGFLLFVRVNGVINRLTNTVGATEPGEQLELPLEPRS